MDPVRFPRRAGLATRWALPRALEEANSLAGVCELELAVIAAWVDVETSLEDATDTASREAQRLLARWASAFLLRLGGFTSREQQAWSKSLDDFIEVLTAVERQPDDDATLDLLDEVSDVLRVTLDASEGDSRGVRISHCVVAAGPAAQRQGTPAVVAETDDPGLSLGIAFGESGQRASTPAALLTGQFWAWLAQVRAGLLPACLPVALLQGLETARTHAITSSDYARALDTEFLVEDETGRHWRLWRRRGRVNVEEIGGTSAV